MLNVPAYVLSKKYTRDTVIGMGALKGANAKIKSIVKENGQNFVTFQWKDDLDITHESTMVVDDGTPILPWRANYHYDSGDIVIYENFFYRCTSPNDDATFNEDHWAAINSPDGVYGLVSRVAELPVRFTAADKKLYYVAEKGIFYMWNGSEWEPQRITDRDIDDLFL